jgi:membrane fusion protein (multidrug efflux system)
MLREIFLYMALMFLILILNPSVSGAADPVIQDCIIKPSSEVNVGSEATGVLEKLLVDRGDYVKKGQVIARLNCGVEQAALESSKARYEYQVRDLQRKAELYTKRFIPSADVDEAETKLKIALREYEEAKEQLERRIIRSPVDGVVMQRMLEAGARVEVDPIMKLAQISPLYAELIVSVKIGDAVAVKPEVTVAREQYIGHVRVVDTVVDAASGTFGIRVQIENKDHSLPAGLKCKAQILAKQKQTKKPGKKEAAARTAPSKDEQILFGN